MSLLLAPYTHAMRLGQGFNSYTQQICIDDAVVIDDQRPENVVTNDGTTMRIMAQKNASPSAWTRQKEVITAKQPTAVLVENAEKAKAEVALIAAELAEETPDETKSMIKSSPKTDDKTDGKGEKPMASEKKSPAKEGASTSSTKDSKAPKHKAADEQGEAGSVDDMPDADEARAKLTARVANEGKGKKPETAALKPAASKKGEAVEDKVTGDAPVAKAVPGKELRGRSSSEKPDSQATEKPSASTPTQPKGDDDTGVDRDEALANLQANSSTNEGVDRDAIAANLRDNTEAPTRKQPIKRSASSDRARQVQAEASAGAPDRAATRAALTGQMMPDHAKAAKEEAEAARRQEEETEILAEQRRYRKELEAQQRKDETERRAEEREEARQIRAEKRQWDIQRREEARKAIAAAADLKATGLADLDKIRAQNQFVERFNGLSEQTQKYEFDPTAPRGPSQTVTYTSRFVDRLSDVMDDMSVSGSLSIKAGKVGGSGKGSFVDSDKFKESDLNFYISVKVVNQTINFKDASVFNPLRSVDANNFREVYGDSYISGFVEGGEFNALVSMKILNKAKKTDIQAEAKIALTAGAVQIEAQANVGIARSNIETNTETTIQVSWSGGGHIKPMEQQWDIQSLMAAASRFPDLVADCPQRTYAILTKYDALRSFVARKPASYTPLQYENAQIYTNALLDSFVSYKSLYKRLGEQIFGVQGKTLELLPWNDEDGKNVSRDAAGPPMMGSKDKVTGLYPYSESDSKFEASLRGLSDARTAIRRQMARIVNEVDLIEKDPKLATDEDHREPYQSPVAFEARIPTIEVPERLRMKSHPLSGRRIAAKELTEEEQKKQIEEEDAAAEGAEDICLDPNKLVSVEQEYFKKASEADPLLGAHFKASAGVGDSFGSEGDYFNNLDFLKRDWVVRSIRTDMIDGALCYLAIGYENGLLVEKGSPGDQQRASVKTFGPFAIGERINSASIEHGKRKVIKKKVKKDAPQEEKDAVQAANQVSTQILGLRLFTNRGRSLIARARESKPGEKGTVFRDGTEYEEVKVTYLDMPFNSGSIIGFFGKSDDSSVGKIYRLGIIWCKMPEATGEDAEVDFTESGDTIDSADFALIQKNQSAGVKALQEKLDAAQKALTESRNKVTELEKVREAGPTVEAQCGSFLATDLGWPPGENATARLTVNYPRPYARAPKLLYGLNVVDAEQNRPRCLSLGHHQAGPSSFNLNVAAFGGTYGHNIGCSWLTTPDDLHLETGMVFTGSAGRSNVDSCVQQIWFSSAFDSPPKIAIWFQEIEWYERDYLSIKVNASDISQNCFYVKIESWANRKFHNARVQWLAYPSEEDGRRVKMGTNMVYGNQGEVKTRRPFYDQPFKNTPKTFIAMKELDFAYQKNLRFRCSANAPNNRELEWSFGTWGDSTMDHGEITWIAIE